MKTIFCSVPFFFRRIDSPSSWCRPLYMLLLRVNKAAKRAQIKKIVHFQASTFLFFIYFFESLMSVSAGQILITDG